VPTNDTATNIQFMT